jgi:agmatine/peptidylarginine deiminase
MSAEEKARSNEIGKGFLATDPPPGPVRNVAEFERMEGVLIRYPFGISYTVVAALSQVTMVTTIVLNQSEQNYVTGQYSTHGVNMANCNFLIAPTDSYWTRDYGPWYIFYGNDQPGIVDFIYNRPRPKDDLIPQKMAEFMGINWYGMDLIATGGNYMTDGYHISSSTTLIWNENPSLTHQQIDQMMLDYLGVTTYHVVPDPNNTYIDHIDCWGKYLDVDKILIREVPPTHPQYDEIEATAAYFAAQTSGYGNLLQVYRVYTPENQPYTNSLILNETVFVPVMSSQWDDEALASYEDAMPGYQVLGLTGSWESTDALHCRAIGTADRGMLFIKHLPLLGDQPSQGQYAIEAEITAYSQQPVIDDSVRVFYRVNGGPYIPIPMTFTGNKIYSASIPGQPVGSEIAYYIHAADQSGRSENHPFIGAPDPHVFYVETQLFPNIVLGIDSLKANCAPGNTTSESFAVSNTGQIDLTYSISWSTLVTEPVADWLVLNPVSGTIEPGGSDVINATFDATQLAAGVYNGTIQLTSNDPDQPVIIIPVQFTVDINAWTSHEGKRNDAILCYPNPFNSSLFITTLLYEPGFTLLEIYNSQGMLVRVLADGYLKAGVYHYTWDRTGLNNTKVAPGVYYYRFRSGTDQYQGKVVCY